MRLRSGRGPPAHPELLEHVTNVEVYRRCGERQLSRNQFVRMIPTQLAEHLVFLLTQGAPRIRLSTVIRAKRATEPFCIGGDVLPAAATRPHRETPAGSLPPCRRAPGEPFVNARPICSGDSSCRGSPSRRLGIGGAYATGRELVTLFSPQRGASAQCRSACSSGAPYAH